MRQKFTPKKPSILFIFFIHSAIDLEEAVKNTLFGARSVSAFIVCDLSRTEAATKMGLIVKVNARQVARYESGDKSPHSKFLFFTASKERKRGKNGFFRAKY
jgi:hypothetical protein